MNEWIRAVLTGFADFLFPAHCFACNRLMTGNRVLCDNCFAKIERVSDKSCLRCGQSIKECDCDRFVYHFDGITAPFYNDGIARQGIYRLKFGRQEVLAQFYGNEMAVSVNKHFEGIRFERICPVPMSAVKRIFRGYNQAVLLADVLEKQLSVPVDKTLLRRHTFNRTQHKTGGSHNRFSNAAAGYYGGRKLSGGNILLVDDIKTTGASLDACARLLLIAGADHVFCVTALIGRKKKKVENTKKNEYNTCGD